MCRTSITRSLSLAAVLGLLAACSGGGAGPVRTEQRDVGDFHAVEMRGAADIVVDIGPAASLTATADATTLAGLKSSVSDGRLIIEHDQHWSWFHRSNLQLRLATPRLDALVMNGAGEVTMNGVAGAKLALQLNGAGKLRASGTIDGLTAHLNGAGDMDLSRLAARDAQVSVNGAGNLPVQASGGLVAAVNGVGSISYAGNPHPVATQINGVGSIRPATADNH
jgi:Putative auto-transporter adhesin, head GIN domain